jgi:hypothetical protein
MAIVRRLSQWFAERQQDAAADITLVGVIASTNVRISNRVLAIEAKYQDLCIAGYKNSADCQ